MLVECANVIATKVRRGLLDASTAAAALEAIDATPLRFVRARAHARHALALAGELRQTAYDCLYLAVAITERAIFITADDAFARAAASVPAYASFVRSLET
jgi:predicted nucleic acid-binding protein